jgi:hypothetical protein
MRRKPVMVAACGFLLLAPVVAASPLQGHTLPSLCPKREPPYEHVDHCLSRTWEIFTGDDAIEGVIATTQIVGLPCVRDVCEHPDENVGCGGFSATPL